MHWRRRQAGGRSGGEQQRPHPQVNLRPAHLTPPCPRDEGLSRPWASSRGPSGRYLDRLRGRRPLLGAASGHVQKECLEPTWQGQLAVSGDAELGGRPQDRGHTVYGGLGGERGGPWAQNFPQAGGRPQSLEVSPQTPSCKPGSAWLTNTHRCQSLSVSRGTWAPAIPLSLLSTRGRWPHGGSRPGVP